jgi:hypothetical protein
MASSITGVHVNNALVSQPQNRGLSTEELIIKKIITVDTPPLPLYDSLVNSDWEYPETLDAHTSRISLSIKKSQQVDNYAIASLLFFDANYIAIDAKSIGFSTTYPGYSSFSSLYAQERTKFIIRILDGE